MCHIWHTRIHYYIALYLEVVPRAIPPNDYWVLYRPLKSAQKCRIISAKNHQKFSIFVKMSDIFEFFSRTIDQNAPSQDRKPKKNKKKRFTCDLSFFWHFQESKEKIKTNCVWFVVFLHFASKIIKKKQKKLQITRKTFLFIFLWFSVLGGRGAFCSKWGVGGGGDFGQESFFSFRG